MVQQVERRMKRRRLELVEEGGSRGGKRGEESQQDGTRLDWLKGARLPRSELNLNLPDTLLRDGVVANTWNKWLM